MHSLAGHINAASCSYLFISLSQRNAKLTLIAAQSAGTMAQIIAADGSSFGGVRPPCSILLNRCRLCFVHAMPVIFVGS